MVPHFAKLDHVESFLLKKLKEELEEIMVETIAIASGKGRCR